jgi:type II secretory pathway component PulF
MTWERFGYICRKANKTLNAEESVSECISRIEGEPNSKLYGDRISFDSLCRKILNEVGKATDNTKAKKMLGVYSEIDLSQHLSEPMQFKRVTIYLAYVTFVFFLVSAIYQLKVAPSFLEAFETFEIPIPSHLLFYRDYWQYFVLAISALLTASLIIGFTLRGLFKFKQGRENGLVLRFLAFKGIRKSYLKIIEVLSFPVLSARGYSTSKDSEIITHLTEIENSGMSLAFEMQALIKAEVQSLLNRCERQMRFVSVLVAVIIVAAIFFFLVSAYSPIFVLGETV